MEARPFFTIITASLNSGTSIRFTLNSLTKQTFRDVEHIVIDGGSTDDTLTILAQSKGQYNLSWISENDKGIADALNKGARKSSGAYFLVIQADDQLLERGILGMVFPQLQDEHYDIHSFPVILDDPIHGRLVRRPIRALWWNRFKFIFPHQGTFVHRRVFERIGGFREDFSIAMDYDFFYRALLAGCSVKFHREPPVALMGGMGIGTRPDFLRLRLREESLVQEMNERNPLWTWLLPRLKPPRKKRSHFDSAPHQSGYLFPD
jgi:glycosyltransferase involved in cell wall biosynthesis